MEGGDLQDRQSSPQGGGVLPVLLYHDVSDGPVGDAFRRCVVPSGLFDEHMSALRSAGYRTESTSNLLATGTTEPEHPPAVYLTFDDGYRSFSESVVPTMAKYGMSGTVFVPTSFIGGPARWLTGIGEEHRQIMTWDELGDLADTDCEIGAHGHEHLPLDLVSRQQVKSELRTGRSMLEDRLGRPIVSLAYPYGFHHAAVRSLARECGYVIGFEVGDNLHLGAVPLSSSDRMLRIRRLIIDVDTSPEQLLTLVKYGRRSKMVQRARCMARPGWRAVRRSRAHRTI